MENFNALLEEYFSKQERPFQIGERVSGIIVHLSPEYAFVDIGLKKEALIPAEELRDREGKLRHSVGDEIKAIVVKKISGEGSYLLSVAKILEEEAWEDLKEAYQKGEPIQIKITKPIKGGYEVEFRQVLKGFLPKSQAPFEVKDEEIPVLILDIKESTFVVSHRAYLEKERALKLKDFKTRVERDEIFQGVIRKVVPGGYLVEIEGFLTGYLPFSEVTRRRVKNLETLLAEGDSLRVKVIEWDPEKEKLKVSVKVLEPDPWERAEELYTLDQRVRGRITKIGNFGAFVEIEPGLEGLLPASEISWKRGVKPQDLLREEDFIEGVIIDFNPAQKKMVLSLKRLEESPWESFTKTLKVGDIVSGKIKTITDFGLFIELVEGVEGFLHISQISWEPLDNLNELFKMGDEVTAKVLEIDFEKKKLILSIKDLQEDPWKEFSTKYKIGDIIEGEIIREISGKGYLIRIKEGVRGFIPQREMPEGLRKSKREELVGTKLTGKIILFEPERKRLWISPKSYFEEMEKREVEEFLKKEEEQKISLGKLLKKNRILKEE